MIERGDRIAQLVVVPVAVQEFVVVDELPGYDPWFGGIRIDRLMICSDGSVVASMPART